MPVPKPRPSEATLPWRASGLGPRASGVDLLASGLDLLASARTPLRPPPPPPAALRPRPSALRPPLPGIAPAISPPPRGPRPEARGPSPDTIYILDLVRRLALQRDLAGAVGVLHLGLGDLVAARVACAIVTADGTVSCPRSDDLRAAAAVVRMDAIAGVARSGRAALTPRAVVVPVPLSGDTRAALIAHRAPTAPELDRRDVAVLTAVATQAAPILHGFVLEHAQRPVRGAGRHRPTAQLTATRARWAYPTVLALIFGLIAAAALIEVPGYSTGPALVTLDGDEITSPTGGTVSSVAVGPGQVVAAGGELLRLHATDEEAELHRVDAEYRMALSSFLFDPDDRAARAALSTTTATHQRALAAAEARVIRATRTGVVSDVRVKPGALLLPGAHVLTIIDRDAAPAVIALLPGSDRPRLHPGMTLQLALAGYSKVREAARITEVGAEVIGPTEARRYLGDQVGDTLPIAGPVVVVRARLPGRTFDAAGRTYSFHDGMPGLGEVQTESRSFLSTLIAKE